MRCAKSPEGFVESHAPGVPFPVPFEVCHAHAEGRQGAGVGMKHQLLDSQASAIKQAY